MRTPARPRIQATLRLLAVPAAVAILTGASLPAQAQFFTSSGANYPAEFFPLDPSAQTLDFTGQLIGIGHQGVGSMGATAGATFIAELLQIGRGGVSGIGTVTIAGAGTTFQLGGIAVGNSGTGLLSVTGGAVVNAAARAAECANIVYECNSYVGTFAGSTGTVNVSGAGSQFLTMRQTIIGNTAVSGAAGTTNASVNVTGGGLFRSQTAIVGQGPTESDALGTEQAFGAVVIDGAGSLWSATRNTIDNTGAFVGVGSGAGGHGSVTVENGGQLIVDGTGGSTSSFDSLSIGSNGGSGSVTVTGLGSSLQVTGNNAVIQIARAGAGGQGALSVLNGATASALLMNVGASSGGTGTLLVDGVGSRLNLIGVGTPGVAGTASAFGLIGRDGGTGQAIVSNGGQWFISDGGQDSRQVGSPGLIVGAGAGANGKLTIDGPGSVVQITSTSLGVPAGTADNRNPFVGIGYDNASTTSGQLIITNGGKLLLMGNGVSTPTVGRATSLEIGGHGPDNAAIGGTGVVSVTGAGSEITLSGNDRFIGVGRGVGGNGALHVADQARVTSTSMAIGENATGVVTIDNALIVLDGVRTNPAIGAGITVGRGVGGLGFLSLTNAGQLNVVNNTLSGGMSIGGDGFVAGGAGAVSLAGGSSIVFSGSAAGGSMSVGNNGTGTLTLDGASTVDVGDTRSIFVGRVVGSTGSLVINGGSKLIGNSIGVGGNSDSVAGGSGVALVTGAGSELRASGADGFISIGRNGTGSLSVADQGTVSATILNVGRAAGGVGTLSVDNAFLALSGQQTTGTLSGAALSIGNRGGSGTASITNGSIVSITNTGSNGASLNVGGTPPNPLGTGALVVSGSQISVVAQPGQATVRVGHDGNGTATFNASSLRIGSVAPVADGSLIIAGQTGSTGTMTLNAGSVVNAAYVGVGATKSATVGVQYAAGAGHLAINNSTVNTTTFEIGAQGVLSGDRGIINATGDVIVGGTIDPGNSPGRIRINCNLISLAGSNLVIDIAFNGTSYDFDEVIIGSNSTFDLHDLHIVFNFLGDADPNAFAQAGLLDLDTFLRAGNPEDETDFNDQNNPGLSTLFTGDKTWSNVIDPALITAMSERFDITELQFNPDDGSFLVVANAVPEPPAWALMLVGLLLMGACTRARRRNADAAVRHPGNPLDAVAA